MFKVDLFIAIILMLLLFLRHTSVYKDRNKINYTPIVVAIGFIAGLLHFVMLGDGERWLLTLRESLLTVIVGSVLSAIMSVMTQTQEVINRKLDDVRTQNTHDDIELLHGILVSINISMGHVTQMESTTHQQLKSIFKEEIEALGSILNNQKFFIQKVESMIAQQQSSQEKFEEFTLSEMPSLDNVVHRHIDMLRISEQDHFNQLKSVIKTTNDEKKEHHDEIIRIAHILEKLQKAQSVEGVTETLKRELSVIVSDFSRHIQAILSKGDGVVNTLRETEIALKSSRDQSELILQQMVLSSKQMRELSHNTKDINDSLRPLGNLFDSAESMFKEFLIAKSKISELMVSLESYDKKEHRIMRDHLEDVANVAISQIEALSEKIGRFEAQNSHITPREVQELSHKVKLHQSYSGE
jgi:hypothetical protein